MDIQVYLEHHYCVSLLASFHFLLSIYSHVPQVNDFPCNSLHDKSSIVPS